MKINLSVLIPARNEARNISACLSAIADWADEILVVDSNSTDDTQIIVERYGGTVIQFKYQGGWPKKRQWALDNYSFRNNWILLLDADEIVRDELKREIEQAMSASDKVGYYIALENIFLGRQLRWGGFRFYKLSLFQHGKGRYEKRIDRHTEDMADIEIHEHVTADGPTGTLRQAIEHRNINNLSRYIEKHNDYSNWEAEVMYQVYKGTLLDDELPPRLFGGNQAQQRRWLKNKFFFLPGFSVVAFVYHYFVRLGFLDGRAGLIYCGFQAVQRFHTKAKVLEMVLAERITDSFPSE